MAKIMTVDDSASVRQMVCLTLEEAGHDVIEAADGMDALTKLGDSKKVDALIVDLNMPRIDGIELIRQVRQKPEYKYIPIIVLSTESIAEKKQAGKAAGATGWIVKPFRPSQLLAVMKKVLR